MASPFFQPTLYGEDQCHGSPLVPLSGKVSNQLPLAALLTYPTLLKRDATGEEGLSLDNAVG